ncbi:uncharacterized protein LOC132396366 [Hypanus sabinus]|uniref:uncharacterized protein LOC132396366 n=1 Tax=Hypanus sabinus TaxID=79690 RepID=UPI0028C4737A|nr:uncharacterized protein LOC132396366 [Hypanus sabinus]XP_059829866.1 uncharacterized protein LOC132396366 [Hypanus sabinus]
MAKLLQAARKVTVTQIITPVYNSGVQRNISRCTICLTLKWMDYSSGPQPPGRGLVSGHKACATFRKETIPEQTIQFIWQNASLPDLTNRHQDLAWLTVRGALPVRSLRYTRNVVSTPLCPREDCSEESVTHLFAHCGLAEKVWRRMKGTVSRFIPSSCVMEDSLIYGLFPGTHTETNIRCCWQIINSVKDALWSARNLMVCQHTEMSVGECCRPAHSRLQEYWLRDTLKLGAATARARWGRTTV